MDMDIDPPNKGKDMLSSSRENSVTASRGSVLHSSLDNNQKALESNSRALSVGPMQMVQRSTIISHITPGIFLTRMCRILQSKISQSRLSN